MNAAILIATRELRDKTRIFITAVALAVLPFLISVLPFVKNKGDESLIALLGGMAAFSMAVGSAAVLGATTLGRELSDGRLSFYFSKPIPSAAIWIGKAAAALIACLVSFAIIALPAWLYAGDLWASTWTAGAKSVLVVSVAGSIVLFFVMHAASTMARSRSPLVALDFALIVAAGIATATILRPLRVAPELFAGVAIALGALALLVLILAPLRQLAVGRTDRRRSHAALSKALWPGIAIVLLAGAAFVAWVVSATPRDLVGQIHVGQAPATGWMVVSGEPRMRGDYHASFLIDPKGEFRRIGPIWWGADFSRDGRVLAWGEPDRPKSPRDIELVTLDLTKADPKPVATGITYAAGGDFVLSDDGRRVAIRQGTNLAVHDLAGARLLFSASVFVSDSRSGQFFFATPDVIRVIQRVPAENGKSSLLLSELDIVRRAQTKTGDSEPVSSPFPIASADGSRIILRREGLLLEGRTGATLARHGRSGFSPMILSDGAVAQVTEFGKPAQVMIHRGTAAPVVISLPGMTYAAVRGEIAPGRIAVQAGPRWEADNRSLVTKIFIIDSTTGAITRVDSNVRGPMTAWNLVDPRPLSIDTGLPLPVHDQHGKVVLWNPRTGEKTPTKIGQ